MKAEDLNFFAELLTITGYKKYFQQFIWAVEAECEKLGIPLIEKDQLKGFVRVLSTEDDGEGNNLPIHVHYYFKDFIAKQSVVVEIKLFQTFETELVTLSNEQLAFQVPFLMGYISHMLYQADSNGFSHKNVLHQSLKNIFDRLEEFRRNYLPNLTLVQITEPLIDNKLNESQSAANTSQINKAIQGFRKGHITELNYNNGVESLYLALRGQGMIPLRTSKTVFRHLFFGDITEKVVWLRPINQLRFLIRGLIDIKLINGEKRWKVAIACFRLEDRDLEEKSFHRTRNPEVIDDKEELEGILNAVRDQL